ncbi:MAG: hypothetical protein K1X89_25290, partial [Myxococcaceae bacterium]|nr:hypothetical protein [Myxococcaceae bacterium]
GGSGSTGGGSGSTGGGSGSTGGGSAGGGTASGGGSGNACAADAGYNTPSKCSCAGFMLCDGFEGAAVDTATWTLDSMNGTAAIESTRFARGAKALDLHATATAGSRAILSETKSFPASGNAFWGRSFIYVDGKAPKVHTGVFEGNGALMSTKAHVRLGFDNGELRPNYLTETGTEYGTFGGPPHAIPTNTWACLEWHYNGPANQYEFYLDEQIMAENTIDGTGSQIWKSPAFSAFELGLLLYQNDTATQAAFDVWFDEFALSTNRVGCGH